MIMIIQIIWYNFFLQSAFFCATFVNNIWYFQESLDIQLTPFLLNTITNIVDAATPVVKQDNPIAVISQLEMHCINEAAEGLPEDDTEESIESLKQGMP